jgi:ClpP class serine protease
LTPEGVAIVPIAGVLSQRFDWLAAACGWTTYEGLSATINSAIDNFGVRGILLDVDTPGGEANGMLDAADAILAAREKKPVWAVANACACSAGYALAGSAEKLVLPRVAIVGSIGCVMMHVDQSVRDAASGLKYTAIYSGARKIDGWAHAPLSEDAQKAAQDGVDHVRDVFADLIGRQGRMSARAALATEAAIFSDADAVKAGLADDVMTFDEALAALTAQLEDSMGTKTALNSSAATVALPARPSAALSAPDAAAAAAAAADTVVMNGNVAAKAIELATAAGKPKEWGSFVKEASAALDAEKDTPPAAKKSGDMTPPEPGEKCELCGQTMPDGEDAPGDAPEQETRSEPAVAAVYTADDATDTAELCAIARLPQLAAGFIKAKTPIKKVRLALAAKAAEVSGEEISAARPSDPEVEKKNAALWDDVVGKVNAENENSAPRRRR